MKQATRIWLIVAAVLIVIGGFMFVGAMSLARWNFGIFSNASYVTSTVDVDRPFKSIAIESNVQDIVFEPSTDGTCKVVFIDRAERECSAVVVNDTLTIKVVDKGGINFGLDTSPYDPRITVKLPLASYATLSIQEDTGDITLPAGYSFESIGLRADTGDIRVDGVNAGRIDVSVTSGHVEMRSVACKGDLAVNVTTGKVLLSGVTCANLNTKGDTGDVKLENVLAAGTINVTRSTGDVRFEHSDAAGLQVRTDTGDVSGSLRTDKIFVTQTDTGYVRVPKTTSGGTCSITTNTGDISITIG
ncbi:MAG: DUF4097 family beta strand repeat protein [Coriobacteriales bacterium]|nr:DUF4097 family beta strand repeat protein [Coriobacteriales bacterium]